MGQASIPDDPKERWAMLFVSVSNIEKKLDQINGRCVRHKESIDQNKEAIIELKSWRRMLGIIVGAAWAGILSLLGVALARK